MRLIEKYLPIRLESLRARDSPDAPIPLEFRDTMGDTDRGRAFAESTPTQEFTRTPEGVHKRKNIHKQPGTQAQEENARVRVYANASTYTKTRRQPESLLKRKKIRSHKNIHKQPSVDIVYVHLYACMHVRAGVSYKQCVRTHTNNAYEHTQSPKTEGIYESPADM